MMCPDFGFKVEVLIDCEFGKVAADYNNKEALTFIRLKPLEHSIY